MNTPDSELRRLTDAWHDGTITREEAVRFEERLLKDEAAREYFFEISEIEAAMAPAAAKLPARPITIPRRSGGWWKMAAVFAIGAFSGAVAWKLVAVKPEPVVRRTGPDATITGMMGVAWEGNGGTRTVDLSPGSDETRIGSGLMELTFGSGTRAVVEGPASFQVLGGNAMRLSYGKMVADVPKGAEGFSVSYDDGKIVDLGTEFGVEVGRNGRSANFGVFRGEIEFHQAGGHKPVKLLENHAITANDGDIQSVPFDQSKFTRKLPSREFAWEIKTSSPAAMTWDYDIGHLVWKSGRYRVICKWMKGRHGVMIDSAELYLDGRRVAEDVHPGFAGIVSNTQGNEYEFEIPSNRYKRGNWTLRLKVRADRGGEPPEDSSGVILVEEGFALNAQAKDFVGTWEYLHDGKVFRREFFSDGTAAMTIDGAVYPTFEKSHWEVVNGCLELTVSETNGKMIKERHMLRDPDTLTFTNCPYRDAHRLKK